jgi:hypothetical protein
VPPPEGAVTVIPLRWPKPKELVALKVAPPEKVMSRSAAQVIVGVPLATEIVVAVPSVAASTPISPAPLEPVQVNAFVIVVVVPEVNATVVPERILRVAIVAAPLRVSIAPFVPELLP